MNASSHIQRLRSAALYLLPVSATALYLQDLLEAKYQQGWFVSQGCKPEAGCVLGSFDAAGWSILGILTLASFALVGSGRPRWGNGLAMAMALLNCMIWISITR